MMTIKKTIPPHTVVQVMSRQHPHLGVEAALDVEEGGHSLSLVKAVLLLLQPALQLSHLCLQQLQLTQTTLQPWAALSGYALYACLTCCNHQGRFGMV